MANSKLIDNASNYEMGIALPVKLAAAATMYALLAYGGVTLTRGEGFFAAVWIPNALAVVALLRFQRRSEPAFFGAIFAGSVGGNWLAGSPILLATGFSFANVTEIALILHILHRTGGRQIDMENVRDLMRLVCVGTFIAPLFSAAIASFTLWTADMASLDAFTGWYLADAMGMMIVAPTVIIIIDWLRGDLTPLGRHPVEWAGLTLCGAALALGVFWQSSYPLLFMIAPIMVVQAFRLGSLGTALAFIAVTLIACVLTAMDHGPIMLVDAPVHIRMLVLEVFLAIQFSISLPVAAAVVQRKNTLARLQRQEEKLALLANNMSDAVLRYDLGGFCTYASASVQDVLGQPVKHFQGKEAAQGVHPDALAGILGVQQRLATGQTNRERLTYRRVLDDENGEPVFVEADCVLVRDRVTAEPATIIVSCRNVTERVNLEHNLKRARRHAEAAATAKSEFLANMSHEIRTPMNGVLGFAELLLKSGLAPEQARYARLIDESGQMMMQLLNDILDISRIDAGQVAIEREAVQLERTIAGCIQLQSANAAQKDIQLRSVYKGDCPEQLMTDSLRLRQIILNLLGNAVKFTEGGTITVEVSANAHAVMIAIEDTGIGIAPERLEAIFNPFEQADNATSRKYGGTGLGLAISRRLAELLEGTLTAHSILGQGSRFELALPIKPLARIDVASNQHAKPAPAPERLPSARILLAEDHDINQILVTTMLERCGQNVRIAKNGAEAIAAVEQASAQGQPFDLILMDIQMPECDGYGAARAIRSMGIGADQLPIIALTANVFADDRRAALDAGMQAHLTKPLRFADLTGTLARWLPNRPEHSAAQSVEPEIAHSPSVDALWQKRRTEALSAVSEAIQSGFAEGAALSDLARIVHKLAGTAGMFGEDELGARALALETSLKSAAPATTRLRLAEELLKAA